MKYRHVLIAAALSVVAASSFAQRDWSYSQRDWTYAQRDTFTPQIDQRQARQEARIERGLQTGRLTEREAMRLQREQREIRRTERAFKADGHVTADERTQLLAMLDRADTNIRRQMRDEDTRYN